MLRLRNGVSMAETSDGIALLDENKGLYWNLNPSGARALRTMLDGGTAEDAAKDLINHYAIDFDRATADIHELIAELGSAGLVEH